MERGRVEGDEGGGGDGGGDGGEVNHYKFDFPLLQSTEALI